eukprot:753180-Hanusia_phi.AAC.2
MRRRPGIRSKGVCGGGSGSESRRRRGERGKGRGKRGKLAGRQERVCAGMRSTFSVQCIDIDTIIFMDGCTTPLPPPPLIYPTMMVE